MADQRVRLDGWDLFCAAWQEFYLLSATAYSIGAHWPVAVRQHAGPAKLRGDRRR